VRASGTLAFRSQLITFTATARAKHHILAALKTTPLRPGHVRLLLVPTRRAVRTLRGSRLRALTVIITIRGGAGTQVRRLPIRLTR
jgi:hypothetical protein